MRIFRGKHLRINLGRSSVKVSVNGKRIRIPPGPASVGYDFRPTKHKALPPGERPCTTGTTGTGTTGTTGTIG